MTWKIEKIPMLELEHLPQEVARDTDNFKNLGISYFEHDTGFYIQMTTLETDMWPAWYARIYAWACENCYPVVCFDSEIGEVAEWDTGLPKYKWDYDK